MKIAYKDHKFKKDSLERIAWANQLIGDYAQQGLSLTLRQLYYRFVAAGLIPNAQREYVRLGTLVSNARLAGLMSWDAIEDRGRNLLRQPCWLSPGDIVKSAAASFCMDLWQGQDYRVEIWVEKQALEAVVGQAAEPLNCPYFACKGYTSQSEMWRASERFHAYDKVADQQPVIIHLGDHDPSGIDMTRDVEERLNDLFGVTVEVRRIALNYEQVEEHKPPPNPAKMSDSRAEGYVRKFGHSSWELDALEPQVLRRLIQSHVEDYLDMGMFRERQAIQEEHRAVLVEASERWGDVERMLSSSGA